MSTIFIILFLLSFVGLIVGLIKPSIFHKKEEVKSQPTPSPIVQTNNQTPPTPNPTTTPTSQEDKKKITRKTIGLTFGLLTFIFMILVGITVDKTEVKSQPTPSPIVQTNNQTLPTPNPTTTPTSQDEQKEKEVITAKEVGDLLHDKGIMFKEMGHPFPPGTYVDDATSIIRAEQRERGMLSQAQAASEHNGDIFTWHIEVYKGIDERNKARIQMVTDCPGCTFLTECGQILVYIPDRSSDERKRDMTHQAYAILRDNLNCQ